MRVIGTVALVALLAGCGGSSTVVAQGDGDGSGARTPGTADERPTGEWRTSSITQSPSASPPGVKPDAFTLRFFDDGRVIAQARCNSISGPYRIADGRFRMDEAAQTEMGCPGDDRHEEDEWLGAFLTSGPAWTFDGKQIGLDGVDIDVVLKPREEVVPNKPVIGTAWTVTHVTDGPAPGAPADPDSAVSAGMPMGKVQLTFTATEVNGNSSCATFSGQADQRDGIIRFGAITKDVSRCTNGDPAVDQVLAVLAGDVLVKQHIATLTLTHSSGKGLQLSADPADGASVDEPGTEEPSGEWRTTKVTAGPGIAPDAFTLTFSDGRVSARARCNTISGAYTIAEGRFVMDQAAQTKMGCPGEGRQEEDQWLVSFLTGKPRFSHDGERITMGTDTDTVVLEPAK